LGTTLLITTLATLTSALTSTLTSTLTALLAGGRILRDRDDDIAQQGDGRGERDGAETKNGQAGHGLDPKWSGPDSE